MICSNRKHQLCPLAVPWINSMLNWCVICENRFGVNKMSTLQIKFFQVGLASFQGWLVTFPFRWKAAREVVTRTSQKEKGQSRTWAPVKIDGLYSLVLASCWPCSVPHTSSFLHLPFHLWALWVSYEGVCRFRFIKNSSLSNFRQTGQTAVAHVFRTSHWSGKWPKKVSETEISRWNWTRPSSNSKFVLANWRPALPFKGTSRKKFITKKTKPRKTHRIGTWERGCEEGAPLSM